MKFFSLILMSLATNIGYTQLTAVGFDPIVRALTHLEKAEQDGLIEDASLRSLHSSTFHGENGKVVSVSSMAQLNYKNLAGQFVPYDIRCKQNGGKWESLNRPDGVRVDENGVASIFNDQGFSTSFGKTIDLNGSSKFNFTNASLTNATHLSFTNIIPGIDKWFDFREGGIKYSYAINTPQEIIGTNLKIAEEIILPDGAMLVYNTEEGDFENGLWKGSILIVDSKTKVIKGKISPLICFDKNNSVVQGYYSFTKVEGSKKVTYLLNSYIEKAWVNDAARAYPVVIDPLVTGPTTSWPGGPIPSCFFPTYSADSMIVTVPAGITVTALNMTASFIATGASGTVMADGRMYFSTDCGQTGVLTVTPPGTTAGTVYMPLTDYRAPLMCCYPQNCSSYTFYLSYHLSRTTNGPLCNTIYLYYATPTAYPFTAYVEGYTPEAYGSEMIFIPGSICANDCTVDARIFCRYGVPPFTFIHPWSADTIVGGTAIGCGTGSLLQIMPLDIPSCPNYCDPSTTLAVPGPIVYDACGVLLSGFNPTYNLTIKPAATVAFDTDSLRFCSGGSFTANVTACLPGATITWTGNGSSGTTLVSETLYNTGTSVSSTMYYANVTINGCDGPPDSMVVFTYPYVVDSFSFTGSPFLVDQPIEFINLTQLNGNSLTGDLWNFGDGSFSILASDTNIYADTGTYQICHYTTTLLGCNDSSCQSIYIVDVELQYPNIITPNGDGINDVLYFKALEYYPGNKLMIFNRWGNELYSKEDYQNDWKGDDLTDGVYYYVLTVPGNEPYKSILHINRK